MYAIRSYYDFLGLVYRMAVRGNETLTDKRHVDIAVRPVPRHREELIQILSRDQR